MPYVQIVITRKNSRLFTNCPLCHRQAQGSEVQIDDGDPVWTSELARIYENEQPIYPNRRIYFKICRHSFYLNDDGKAYVPKKMMDEFRERTNA
jgi:hypothetical protein